MELICINDIFPQEWEVYFKKYGITKPIQDSIYSIRQYINFMLGEKGILLCEIVNPETPRISPTTGIEGMSEQAWAISRFTDLMGKPLTKEEARKTIHKPALQLTQDEKEELGFDILKTI